MNLIQLILIVSFSGAALLCWVALKNRLAGRLFFILQFLLGIVLTVFPDLAQAAATFLGVGRGTDLVLYLLVILVYVGALLILARFRSLEGEISALVRQMALREACTNPPPERGAAAAGPDSNDRETDQHRSI